MNITVTLTALEYGNPYIFRSRVRQALRKAGSSQEYVEKYSKEAGAHTNDTLLQITNKYVNIKIID